MRLEFTEPVSWYILEPENVPKVLYGVEIFHGSELNVLNDGTLSLSDNYIYF